MKSGTTVCGQRPPPSQWSKNFIFVASIKKFNSLGARSKSRRISQEPEQVQVKNKIQQVNEAEPPRKHAKEEHRRPSRLPLHYIRLPRSLTLPNPMSYELCSEDIQFIRSKFPTQNEKSSVLFENLLEEMIVFLDKKCYLLGKLCPDRKISHLWQLLYSKFAKDNPLWTRRLCSLILKYWISKRMDYKGPIVRGIPCYPSRTLSERPFKRREKKGDMDLRSINFQQQLQKNAKWFRNIQQSIPTIMKEAQSQAQQILTKERKFDKMVDQYKNIRRQFSSQTMDSTWEHELLADRPKRRSRSSKNTRGIRM